MAQKIRTSVDTDGEEWESEARTTPPRKTKKSRSRSPNKTPPPNEVAALPTPSPTPPMPPARPLALLVCSIGNPGASYANTLHSAGHTLLNRLAQHLNFTSFQKDRSLANGLVSTNPYPSDSNWTLWQSPSYMNESGKPVRTAWQSWSKPFAEGEARLVIVHDELEKPLGSISVKTTQGASAKGHNGLKSLMGVMGKTPFVRVGVGIGRPESRSSGDVASYVLKKMTSMESGKIEAGVEEVVERLRVLEKG